MSSKPGAAAPHDGVSKDDHITVLRDAAWSDYQRLQELRSDRPVPRLAFSEGELELMTPSRAHENLKSVIGCLVEVWCHEQGIEFGKYGSWTLESKEAQRGVEPDECYVFGDVPEPGIDLEVLTTFLDRPTTSQAIRAYRATLRAPG